MTILDATRRYHFFHPENSLGSNKLFLRSESTRVPTGIQDVLTLLPIQLENPVALTTGIRLLRDDYLLSVSHIS
jgi:hypothetical protein